MQNRAITHQIQNIAEAKDPDDISVKLDTLHALLRRKNCIDFTANDFFPLHQAVDKNLPEVVALLLEYNAPRATLRSTVKPNIYYTAIVLAAYGDKWDCVKEFAKHRVNNKDEAGYSTAVLYAVNRKQVAVVKALLDAGAIVDDSGKCFFPDTGSNALHLAVESRNLELLELLLSKANKAAVNARNKKGYTPLHLAAEKNFSEAIKPLIQSGADFSLNVEVVFDQRYYYYTPAKLAAFYCSWETVIAFSHCPHFRFDHKSENPIVLYAVDNGENAVVFEVLRGGLSVSLKEPPVLVGNETALHRAVIKNNPVAVSLLVARGFRQTRNTRNQSPLDLSTELGYDDCTSALAVSNSKEAQEWLAEYFLRILLQLNENNDKVTDDQRYFVQKHYYFVDKTALVDVIKKSTEKYAAILNPALDQAESVKDIEEKQPDDLHPLAKLILTPQGYGYGRIKPDPTRGRWLELKKLALQTEQGKKTEMYRQATALFKSMSQSFNSEESSSFYYSDNCKRLIYIVETFNTLVRFINDHNLGEELLLKDRLGLDIVKLLNGVLQKLPDLESRSPMNYQSLKTAIDKITIASAADLLIKMSQSVNQSPDIISDYKSFLQFIKVHSLEEEFLQKSKPVLDVIILLNRVLKTFAVEHRDSPNYLYLTSEIGRIGRLRADYSAAESKEGDTSATNTTLGETSATPTPPSSLPNTNISSVSSSAQACRALGFSPAAPQAESVSAMEAARMAVQIIAEPSDDDQPGRGPAGAGVVADAEPASDEGVVDSPGL